MREGVAPVPHEERDLFEQEQRTANGWVGRESFRAWFTWFLKDHPPPAGALTPISPNPTTRLGLPVRTAEKRPVPRGSGLIGIYRQAPVDPECLGMVLDSLWTNPVVQAGLSLVQTRKLQKRAKDQQFCELGVGGSRVLSYLLLCKFTCICVWFWDSFGWSCLYVRTSKPITCTGSLSISPAQITISALFCCWITEVKLHEPGAAGGFFVNERSTHLVRRWIEVSQALGPPKNIQNSRL